MIFKIRKLMKKEKLKRVNIKKNSKFLKSGEYIIHDSRKFAYLKNYANNQTSIKILGDDQLISKKSLMKRLFIKFMKSSISIRNSKKIFKGTIYFFTRNHLKDRIFDMESQQVKILFDDWEEKERYLSNYTFFGDYFKQPAIIKEGDIYLIEELVDAEDQFQLTNKVYQSILSDFNHYYEQTEKVTDPISSSLLLDELRHGEDVSFFDSVLDNELKTSSKHVVKGHGDLRKENILISKSSGDIFYIDWDFTEQYTHHYDLFFLIYFQAKYADYALLDQYLKGEFDQYFIEGFSIFNENFDIEKRSHYIYEFMLEHYSRKVDQDPEVFAYYKSIDDYLKNKKDIN